MYKKSCTNCVFGKLLSLSLARSQQRRFIRTPYLYMTIHLCYSIATSGYSIGRKSGPMCRSVGSKEMIVQEVNTEIVRQILLDAGFQELDKSVRYQPDQRPLVRSGFAVEDPDDMVEIFHNWSRSTEELEMPDCFMQVHEQVLVGYALALQARGVETEVVWSRNTKYSSLCIPQTTQVRASFVIYHYSEVPIELRSLIYDSGARIESLDPSTDDLRLTVGIIGPSASVCKVLAAL